MIEIRLCAIRPSAGEEHPVWPAGVRFEGAFLIDSVVHALALAGDLIGEQTVPDAISSFVNGRPPYSPVPTHLGSVGVVSAAARGVAEDWARWIRPRINAEFEREVRGMFGDAAVGVYQAVARDLARVFLSTRTHQRDVCVVAG